MTTTIAHLRRDRRRRRATTASTAAAYMAKAGLRVLVLEARGIVGGAAVTEELGGVRVPTLAHTVGRLRPSVARELELATHGLALVAPEVRVFAPAGRRPRRDAVRGPRAGASTRCAPSPRTTPPRSSSTTGASASLSRFLADLGDEAPPEIKGPGFGDALLGLRLGRAFRGLGKDDGRTILRVLAMAAADFVAESFESEPIRATLAWRGVRYTAMGPWSAGHDAGAARRRRRQRRRGRGRDRVREGRPVRAVRGARLRRPRRRRGDPHRRAGRRRDHARRRGHRRGARVRRGDRGPGRRLRPGPEAAAHDARGPGDGRPVACAGAPATSGRPGTVAKVNLVLDGLPEFPAAGGDARQLRGRIQVGTTSIDDVEQAFDASKYGAPAGVAGARGDDPVARGPVARRRARPRARRS